MHLDQWPRQHTAWGWHEEAAMGNDKGALQLSSCRRWSASASPVAIVRCPQGRLPRGPPAYIHQSRRVAKKNPPLVQIFGTPSKCQT